MVIHTGFIIKCEDAVDFYQIKRFVQGLPDVRLVYCTMNDDDLLYIKTASELAKLGEIHGYE